MDSLAGTRPSPRPWWKRKWGIAGIVVGLVLAAGGISNAVNPPVRAQASPTPPGVAAISALPAVTALATAISTPDSTVAPTPQPTVAATPEPTVPPTPDPTPAPVAVILKASGRGDKVVKFAAQDTPTFARITGKGSGNFAVISYVGSTYGDLLVNEIGAYSGWVYIAPAVNRLKISASSSWTVGIRPIDSARGWDGTTTLAGKGDSVVILSGGASGITTIKNKSSSNFSVIAYSPEGNYLDLLVNEIGSYTGEVLLPDSDPIVLAIKDVGGVWSMSPVSQ